MTVQKSTSYNTDKVVAPNSRRKARWSPTIGRGQLRRPWTCRQPQLLEHILGQLALCTTSDRSLGIVWHEVLGQVQVLVLVQVVGLVCLVGAPHRFLAISLCHLGIAGLRRKIWDGRGCVARDKAARSGSGLSSRP